jgi:hypothetical protein
MTTKTKKRQKYYLDPNHPNYAELINAGLSERDYCEFYVTSDGKAIAFDFDNLDEYMTYLRKLQGSKIEVVTSNENLLGWKYTDSFCLDNRPDGEGWVKFEITTYADILSKEIPHDTAHGKDDLLYVTADLVSFAHDCKNQDVYFRFGKHGLEMDAVDRNQMNIDNYYMGIVFNLSDVKP